jgi:hypothetical protein
MTTDPKSARREPKRQLERVSLDFYPPEAASPGPDDDDDIIADERDLTMRGSHFPRMYAEDVRLGTFPIGARVAEKRLHWSLEPSDHTRERMVVDALNFGESFGARDESLAEAVCEWGNHCASAVAMTGRCLFELAYWVSGDSLEPVGFALVPLNRYRIERSGYAFLQLVPEGARALGKSPRDGYQRLPAGRVTIPGERIVEVAWPHFESSDVDVSTVFRLLGPDAATNFVIEGLRQPAAERVPLDYDLARRTERVAIARATKAVGWDGRSHFSDYQTEYYSTARMLRFVRFKCQLRELVLSALDDALSRVGQRMGFCARLGVSGLPTAEDVVAAERELAAGSVGAADLRRRFRML